MRLNFAQIQDVWNRSLTAETIAEPIVAIACSDEVSKAFKLMKEKGFDVLGIENENFKVIGYIETDDSLKGTCQEHCRTFDIEDLVSLQTPLKDCMSRIANKKRLFVLGTNRIEGIITLADLHKQSVRMFLFSIISLLEMTMGQLISSYFPNKLWCDQLPDGRLKAAQNFYDERKRVGQEIDLADCLQLCDKCQILSKINNMWKNWGFDSKNKADDFFKNITDLRNNLAHSQKEICSDISSIIGLCDIAEGVITTNINTISADLWEAVIDDNRN